MSFGWGVGDIMTISGLAVQVYTAYKDAPDDYRNIADEVKSLQIIVNKAAWHFKSSTLSQNSLQEGQQVLRGCQKVLEDLNFLIEKLYHSLADSANNTNQVLRRIRLGTEDIATLRVRLISHTGLLNGFIQSCEFLEMQARLTDVLGLHRTNSRVSIDSIASFAGSINTKKAYKKFCKGLYKFGVTVEMISQKEGEIHEIFKSQHSTTCTQIGDSSSVDQSQLRQSGNPCNTETPLISTIPPENKPGPNRSRFAWVRSPMDFLVGTLTLGAAEARNSKRQTPTLEYTQNIDPEDDKREALHKAANRGHKDMVQFLLTKGTSIEATCEDNRTPLHIAAISGHTDTVELLLAEGALIEAMTKQKNTPLHLAARNGRTSTVEHLLTKGASIEAMNDFNETSLHLAANNGHTSTVELLLSKGASIEAITERTNTPLHLAAYHGHTSTVELLLTKGVLIEATTKENDTPLHIAAYNGHRSTVELLLTKGALIEAMASQNDTPLHLAAFKGHTSTVGLLLTEGASINTPLLLAVQNSHTQAAKLLRNQAAEPEFIGGK